MAPPNMSGMNHNSFVHMVRSEWTRGYEEEDIQAMLRSFEFIPGGSVRPKLGLLEHMTILRDLYENPPNFENVIVPVLFLPAGSGGSSAFSRHVQDDINDACTRINSYTKNDTSVAPVKSAMVEWFPDATHMVPLEQPQLIMQAIVKNIESGFFMRK